MDRVIRAAEAAASKRAFHKRVSAHETGDCEQCGPNIGQSPTLGQPESFADLR